MTEIMKDLEKEKLEQISDISPKKSTKKIKKKKKIFGISINKGG